MVALRVSLLLGLLACTVGKARPAGAADAPALTAIRTSELIVTSGQVEPASEASLPRAARAAAAQPSSDHFLIRSPTLRAWVGREPRSSVELDFAYLGPTDVDAPLGSGELRRQIGLELRAQDSCNVLYVMWRIAPVAKLVVALKSNPGQRQHRECLDRGYTELESERSGPLPPLQVGEHHVLSATLLPHTASSRPTDLQLEVRVDGESRWRGPLPAAAMALTGPVGLRSDNGQFDVRLRAGSPKP